ncbi:ATP-binding cassette domain-containing protein [Erysipelothrix sp. HDW6C]|uniref:ABC transporter ATP-binding protein/permease n=1 Tax=Erysipelothrix sp. HDW6C TaxID=2714930 RepID=UPI001409FAA6|nr:ABC transporter ATP-binding protein/permease [Erysipelothrix sp. HDW6C]QIK68813.1 ATP-binding cassette domain-containing protein [Erysipelothrix sp. HDW6C]
MLELKNIKKSYVVGDITTVALNDVSIAFREQEFVAILGTSGSGKTTSLNIIGGLDRYDSGHLIINGRDTSNFAEKDWDAYRNNSIGFVFQSYNLINHLSIVANVEMGMTLSGVSSSEKNKKAIEVLKLVGLEDHLHKKPNQLSGGQQQRVAIARALANDPEILLCDEPTGALDSETSTQIMDLIKEVASDRLVIMVTHNPELAHDYADRIVEFKDGKIISDSNPYVSDERDDKFVLKHTSMSFFTALKLSFNNIRTKKGRTFLTSFASSIGIIGIAVILSLSSGFQIQIDKFQADAMSEFPIIISQSAMNMDEETMKQYQEGIAAKKDFVDSDEVYLYNPKDQELIHKNKLDAEFLDYLSDIDPEYTGNIGYTYITGLNLLREVDGKAQPVSFTVANNNSQMGAVVSGNTGISTFPININPEKKFLEGSYDILAGDYPASETDLVLVVDEQNRIDENLLEGLGFDIDGMESMKFSDIVGTEVKWIPNNAYYKETRFGNFLPNDNYDEMYADSGAITLRISAVVRQGKDSQVAILNKGIVYSDALSQRIIELSKDSDIVNKQKDADYNILSMEKIDDDSKKQVLSYLGGSEEPVMVTVYPKDFENKDKVLDYLDAFNKGKVSEDNVVYTDLASTMTNMTKGIMDGITIVLIAFAAISLVVSLIMIGIITYTSVIERTKEIGILKALGARKKDITRVFDAETFILGVFSGTLGVVIAYLLTFPINAIIFQLTDLSNVAQLQPLHAIILVAISTVLTMIGGHIPAKIASKKDPVVALQSE